MTKGWKKDFWGFSSDWFVWWEVDKGNKNCQFIWEYKTHNKPHKECKGDAKIKSFQMVVKAMFSDVRTIRK